MRMKKFFYFFLVNFIYFIFKFGLIVCIVGCCGLMLLIVCYLLLGKMRKLGKILLESVFFE